MTAPAPTTPRAPRFDLLAPRNDDYATLPIPSAFTWDEIADVGTAGEWYLVVFRSRRRLDADEALLTLHDERAHAEAEGAPGFVHYFKGPLTASRDCLSFCLWSSRPAARAASGKPDHREAVLLASQMYERYELEFYRVTQRLGEARFDIEPFDSPALAA